MERQAITGTTNPGNLLQAKQYSFTKIAIQVKAEFIRLSAWFWYAGGSI